MGSDKKSQNRPQSVYVLIALLLIVSFSALYGGFSLMADPLGQRFIPYDWLESTPFSSFLLPGLILFFVLGVFPLLVAGLLYLKPQWSVMDGLTKLTHEHWSWLASLSVGVALITWIVVQFLMLGARHPIQIGLELFCGILGISILSLSLLPAVRSYYAV